MSRAARFEKADIDPEHLEVIQNDTARLQQTHYEPQSEAERVLNKRVNLKLDLIVVSLLAVEFIFCGIDKTNVGFVATSSFPEDANLAPDDIPNSLSLFSATYVPLQPFMVILARRVGVKYFLGCQLLLWGGLCMCHAAIRGSGTLIALRLLIGAAEAGFTQIGMYFMSTLYPKYDLGFRVGMFTGMYSVAGAFAGVLAYGLLRVNSSTFNGWQIVFLVEGGITVFLGIITFFVLPKNLSTAWFLTPEERAHAVGRLEIDLAGTQEEADIGSTSVVKRDFIDVAKDWKKLMVVICNMTTVLPVTAFTTFLPLIVQGMGYRGIKATLMSVSPFVAGVAGLLIIVWSSDRRKERSFHTVGGVCLGIIGCVVMATSTNTQLRYGFAHVCMAGVFVGGPLLAVLLAGNTPWKGTRSVMMGVNGWSNIAGVIAGQIFKSKYAPRYEVPLIITIIIMACGICGLVFIKFMYRLENKKRAREIANWDDADFTAEAASTERRGDQRRTFVHVRGHKERQTQDQSSCAASQGSLETFPTTVPNVSSQAIEVDVGPASVNSQTDDGMNQVLLPSVVRPEGQVVPHDAASSLLWPDSEDLFQSLINGTGTSWDQTLPATFEAGYVNNEVPQTLRSARDEAQDEELAAAEDSHRAVVTINGLLTNTLFNVTSHVELSSLTPRFLDSSLHMFFTKFVPIMPLIHRPTFVYRDFSAPLLLNAIALGSLFFPSEDATAKGEALWRLAYTAIATAWSEMIGHRGEYDTCCGVELVLTALLSQTYAALSKSRTLRMTSQTFYGLILHWAQYCGMYDVDPHQVPIPALGDPIETKMYAWKTWAARETQLRTLLGLCVIDGIVSQFSGNPVNTWSETHSLPLSADENAFGAETVDKWIRVMRATREGSARKASVRFYDLRHSLFSNDTDVHHAFFIPRLFDIKILLEVLAAQTTDFERTDRGPAGTQRKLGAMRALVVLRQHLARDTTLTPADRSIALLRWHAVCLDLVVSTAQGARRMCSHYDIPQHIFGGRKRLEPRKIDPEGWTRALSARKCLLHALEIQKYAFQVPLGVIHDTCLPGSLFAAATTYSSFVLPGITKILVPATVDWEIIILHGLGHVVETVASTPSESTGDTLRFLQSVGDPEAGGWEARNLLYELSSIRILLHSLSQHWGVTQEMEEVVGAWEARCN
ncbi:putative transporter [Paramyrothecium foliicola]|nr:putative transporter [Paramyrothecium foliicola]